MRLRQSTIRHAQGSFRFSFVFWLHAETAVVQDLCLVEGDTKIEICRGKWGSGRKNFTFFSVSWPWCNIDREVPNNATLAWWLIMRTSRKRCRRRVELAGEAVTAAESVFFLKFLFCLSRSLIDFSHQCNEKQRNFQQQSSSSSSNRFIEHDVSTRKLRVETSCSIKRLLEDRVETSCSIKRLLEDEELCCWL